MKKMIYLILIFVMLGLSSCIKIDIKLPDDTNFSDLTVNQRDNFIRYIYTAYNKGAGYDFDKLKSYADDANYKYDDNVLAFYKYLVGEYTLNDIKTRVPFDGTDKHYDERIITYIKSIITRFQTDVNNTTSTNWFIGTFNEKVPSMPSKYNSSFNYLNPELTTAYDKRTELINRVYDLLKYYYGSDSVYLFGEWFKEYFPTKSLSDTELKEYATYLVDCANAYTNTNLTLNRKQSTTSTFYKEKVIIKDVPVELLLATSIQESRLFPGSFRAEVINDNIYAVSFGLTHTLIDADFLYLSDSNQDIGDDSKGERNFDLLSYWYFGNNRNEETYFSDWDLMTVRGSFLYASTFLELIYQKYISFIK
ncbi:hypothetical protein OSSY52_06780 [Tepiditoga spiralis]|uniref:Lipoprotein n=1 Tax=Tepiditoga spiralis TaxID=2108365 RepID=A0A7G1G6L7_9BACT|nr:hypothetical protein [Tepiditoga spiralis]BBE30537.1 hypothetical protein OSSY52_06780 [Tepiditoga spiralis]